MTLSAMRQTRCTLVLALATTADGLRTLGAKAWHLPDAYRTYIERCSKTAQPDGMLPSCTETLQGQINSGRSTWIRMGWLDDVTNALLGEPVDGIKDGVAAEVAEESALSEQLAELQPKAPSDPPLHLQTAEPLLQYLLQAVEGFDGRQLRDLIVAKWGKEFDVEFTQTDYLGKASLYLNVFPWSPDRTPYRHESQEVYLEHLQAVAELLIRWGRVASVKRQIQETDKSPRRGTIPIKTVPLRLDLPNELVRSFRK